MFVVVVVVFYSVAVWLNRSGTRVSVSDGDESICV